MKFFKKHPIPTVLLLLALAGLLTLGIVKGVRSARIQEAEAAAREEAAREEAARQEALSEQFHSALNRRRVLTGDKLVAYLTDEDRYTMEWIPESLQASSPEELGGVVTVTSADYGRRYDLHFQSTQGKPLGLTYEAWGYKEAGDVHQLAAMEWVEECWSGDGQYEIAVDLEKAHEQYFGKGDKLCLGLPYGFSLTVSAILPDELRAASPWQIGAFAEVEDKPGKGIIVRFVPFSSFDLPEHSCTYPRTISEDELLPELQSWISREFADNARLVQFHTALESGEPLGGGDKIIGRIDGKYDMSNIPEDLQASSPSEVGLIVDYDGTFFRAILPTDGTALGSVADFDVGTAGFAHDVTVDPEAFRLFLEEYLSMAQMQRLIPLLLESETINPTADKLMSSAAEGQYRWTYIPEDLQAKDIEELRGILYIETSMRETSGWYTRGDGASVQITLRLEIVTVRLVDLRDGRTVASKTFQAQAPSSFTSYSDATSHEERIDPEDVTAWVAATWHPAP